jgi:hypothetical protein
MDQARFDFMATFKLRASHSARVSNRQSDLAVPTANQARGMVETSLEAVALCGASLLSDAFAPVPSPSERGFLNSSPQAEPRCRFPALGSPDDFCDDLRFIPLDATCELTAARTTVDCSNTPS